LALEIPTAPLRHASKPKLALPGILDRLIPSGEATAEYSPERRRHKRSRIAAPRPALVHIDRRNAALVVNLGVGGMRVRALGRPVAPGATLRLKFQLPGSSESMHTEGVVAWVNDLAEAGIQFVKLSEARARPLREWLAKNGVLNAAREFLSVAGGWQAALDLIAELTRMLTGAPGVSLTLAGGRPIYSSLGEAPPIRTTVAAPVYQNEQIVGHLEIYSTEFGAFDEWDLRALSVLAAVLSEMVRLRAADRQEAAPKAPPLSARIVNRIEGMFPKTVRVRVVLRAANPSPP